MDGQGMFQPSRCRVWLMAKDDAERARKVNAVHQYYGRFDNIIVPLAV